MLFSNKTRTVLFNETRTGSDIIGTIAGPVPITAFDLVQAIKYGIRGEGGKAGRTAYRAVSSSIPFLNLIYYSCKEGSFG